MTPPASISQFKTYKFELPKGKIQRKEIKITELKRIVRRKVESRSLRYPLIAQLESRGILKLREKDLRRWYSISLEELYKTILQAKATERY